MVELDKETVKALDKMHKLRIHDFFHGPDAVRSREFIKFLKREPTLPVDEIKAELDEWASKREEILNG